MNHKTTYVAWMAGTLALLIAGSDVAPNGNGFVRMPNRQDGMSQRQDTSVTLVQEASAVGALPAPDLMDRQKNVL